MKNSLPSRLLRLFRRLLNTDQIANQLRRQERGHHHCMAIAVGNGLTSAFTAPEKLRSSVTYQRCAELISLLSPMDVAGGSYVRVGKSYDGGYVMLDNFQEMKPDAAYSFGISDDVSWDEAMAGRGLDVFMYDHTIEELPKSHAKFHYFKLGVTGVSKAPDLKTLGEHIAHNGHKQSTRLIMKMDVEGAEWDVLTETASSVLSQFSQIVIELHHLSAAVYDPKFTVIADALKKLNQTHQCVHVHANAAGVPLWMGELVLPGELEVTYIRRTDVQDRLRENTRQFPTAIDQPTYRTWPDIHLGSFSARK